MEELLLELKDLGIDVLVEGQNLKLNVPDNLDVTNTLEKVKLNKAELIEYIMEVRSSGNGYNDIKQVPQKAYYRLSPAQERLFFLHEFDKTSLAYNLVQMIKLNGVLDIKRLENAFVTLLSRHDSLRTVFDTVDGAPVQKVLKQVSFNLETFTSGKQNMSEIIEGFVRPFDLSRGPLMRIGLVELARNEHILMVDMHHIITDGVSQGIMFDEFIAHYNDENPPALKLQFKDYVIWQFNEAQQAQAQNRKAFWVNEFSGELPMLDLPLDFSRPPFKKGIGAKVDFAVDASTTKQLRSLASKENTSLYTVLLSSLNVLLAKLCNQEDIIIGTPVAGRSHADLDGMIGMFVNTLPLRFYPHAGLKFVDLLDHVNKRTLQYLDNQSFPFESLINELNIKRNTSRNPLFDVMFVFQNFQEYEIEKGGLSIERYDSGHVLSQMDMTLNVTELKDTLQVRFEYSQDIFSEESIQRFTRYFQRIIACIIQDSHQKLLDINVLSGDERDQLLFEFNNTASEYPKNETVISLFEKKAIQTPDTAALILADARLNYSELNARVNQLARFIGSNGVEKGSIVALKVERSFEMIIGLMAILKSGGAYLPIDPQQPINRTRHMLSDSEAIMLITDNSSEDEETFTVPTVNVKDPLISAEDPKDLKLNIQSEQLAYVIYTSGSTGLPKGVMVSHNSIVNLIFSQIEAFGIDEFDKILQFSSINFDASVEQIWMTFLAGASLVLVDKNTITDTKVFKKYISTLQVTHLHATPSFIQNIDVVGVPCLKRVVAGGETCTVELAERYGRDHIFYNEYGPTETTVTALMHRHVPRDSENSNISIGKPIANTRVYILDSSNKIQPIGVPGELCIAGDGMAIGYLNQPKLTSQKFISNPYNRNELLYKTGDLARWRSDGNIEFLGRMDDQVKVNGYRIELGEIEHRLRDHSELKETIVLAKEGPNGKYLVAYYVSERPVSQANLRSHLSSHLPDYMLPSYYVHLERFPLAGTGKIDRRALPDPAPILDDKYEPPVTHKEKLLCQVWSDVLGVESIGISDNFFSVGGDSIKSIQIRSRVREAGYDLTVRDIFTYQTIEDLASRLEDSVRVPDQSEIVGEIPLSPIQHWFLEGNVVSKHHYNQAVMLNFSSRITEAEVRKIFTHLQGHHDALRMVFKKKRGDIIQENRDIGHPLSLEFENLTKDERPEDILLNLCNTLQSGINLETGPLMKLGLYELGDGSRLFIAIHHLIVDGVSWRILLEDIETLYLQIKNNSALKLPMKTDSFLWWSNKLQEYSQTASHETGLRFWDSNADVDTLVIKRDYEKGANLVEFTEKSTFELNATTTARLLREVHTAFNTQINDLLLAALLMSMNKLYGQGALKIDLEGHGREDIIDGADISRTVGWFTSIYPVLLESKEQSPSSIIKSVKESLQKIPSNGIDYLVGKFLGEGLSVSPKEPGAEASMIVFNYLGQFDSDIENRVFEVAEDFTGDTVSKNEPRNYEWDILGMVSKGKLRLSLAYSSKQYDKETIDVFMHSYQECLVQLIDHCLTRKTPELTPSDLTYSKLTIPELEKLQVVYKIEDVYTLSPMQESMLYHALLDEAADHYFEQMSYRLKGALDIDSIQQSFQALVNRHAVLRTVFVHYGLDRPLQVVLAERKVALSHHDIRGEIEKEGRDVVLNKYKFSDREQKFDLTRDVLMRITIFHTGDDEYEFVWSHHHILMDGWCMGIMVNEFDALYHGCITGTELSLPKLQPYSKYIDWLELIDKRASAGYWETYLKDYESLATFPKGVYQNLTSESQEANSTLTLTKSEVNSLNKLSRRYGVTLNTIIQSAWGILLSRYNGVNDVVFGAVVSGRPPEIDGVETIVGLFINTIPVRIQYHEKDTVSDLLQRVQYDAISSEPNHYQALAEIQSTTSLGMGLLDHVLVFENYPVAKEIERSNQEEKTYQVEAVNAFEKTNYDLTIVVVPGEEYNITFDHNKDVYDVRLVEAIKSHLGNILNQIVREEELLISSIDMLSEREKIQLMEDFNDTSIDYPSGLTIIDLFEEQVEKTPKKTALVYGENSISYEELNSRSNDLASRLLEVGVQPETRVGLLFEAGPEGIIGMIGVLKAGGAYVPLDVDSPFDRMKYQLSDSQCAVLLRLESSLDHAGLNDLVENVIEVPVVSQSTYRTMANLGKISRGSDLAYIVYTSGTTGLPKGVMIEHGSIYNTVRWRKEEFDFEPNDEMLQLMKFSFDVFVLTLFAPLVSGISVYVANKVQRSDAQQIAKIFQRRKVTHMYCIPVLYSPLLDELSLADTKNLRYVVMGGYDFGQAILKKSEHKAPYAELINEYGPTENSVLTTWFRGLTYEHRISIGKPIANTEIFILGAQDALQPVGVVGELCISGFGLARGYLNNTRLTEEKFTPHPFKEGKKIYRTGDLARWLPDGNIEFLGRHDDQVKIRGYRIELGEIESILTTHDKVEEAIITVSKNSGEKYLIAYYLSEQQIASDVLRKHLSAQLPDYMLPAYFVQLDKFPLTSNGKIDVKSLPEPDVRDQGDYVAPSSDVQEKLVELWSELLEIDKEIISVNRSFFNLGGHSLKATLLVNKISKIFDVDITLKQVFAHQDILGLSELIEASETSLYSSIESADEKAWYPTTPAQRRLYFLYEFDKSSLAYNMPQAVELKGDLNKPKLESAINKLINRHEGLRTSFDVIDGDPVQKIVAKIDFKVAYFEADKSEVEAIVEEFVRPFDLKKGPMIQVGLINVLNETPVLMVDIHHIITDGVSQGVLIEDFEAFYYHDEELPALTVQYKDYAEWLGKDDQLASLKDQELYWKKELQGSLPILSLPIDFERSGDSDDRGGFADLYLQPEEYENIMTYCGQHDVTPSILIYALFSIVLAKLSGQEDIIVGLSSTGRNHPDLDRIMGMFVNSLPVRTTPRTSRLFDDYVSEVKSAMLSGLENQNCQFDTLVNVLGIERIPGRNPIFDVMLNFIGRFEEEVDLSNKAAESTIWGGLKTKRFDLTLNVIEYQNTLHLNLQYDASLFEPQTAQKILNYINSTTTYLQNSQNKFLYDIQMETKSGIEEVHKSLKINKGSQSAANVQVPASYHQERLWFIDKFESGYLYDSAPIYHNVPLIIDFEGTLNTQLLQNSISEVINLHPILRTVITDSMDKPYQIVMSRSDAKLAVIQAKSIENDTIHQLVSEEIGRPFSLDTLLVRAALFQLNDHQCKLVMTIHHAIVDRYSVYLLAENILLRYKSLVNSDNISLKKPMLEYKDFSNWQKDTLKNLDTHFLSYWKTNLAGRLQPVEFPTDRPRAMVHTYTAASDELNIDSNLYDDLFCMAGELQLDMNTLLMSVFKVCLFKYCGHEEIVIGTTYKNRDYPLLEDVFGPISNLLVLRSVVRLERTFVDYSRELNRIVGAAEKFGSLPFDKLVSEIAPEKDMSRTALFDVLFDYEDTPIVLPEINGLKSKSTDINLGFGKYDLNLFLRKAEKGIEGRLVFNADYFDAASIKQFVRHYLAILSEVTKNYNQKISSLKMLSSSEELELCESFDNTPIPYPSDKTIIDLFQQQALRASANVALSFEEETVSYGELESRSNYLGHLLRKEGVARNTIVALLMDRSIETVVAMLSILKAGGAYLPIDVDYPEERIRYLLNDSKASVLLTTKGALESVQYSVKTICLEDIGKPTKAFPSPELINRPSDLCYVIYTSGTTGMPKGVMVEHRNVVRLLFNEAFQFDFGSEDIWTMFHSHAFDFSVWEMYGALLYGGKLIIVPKMLARDPHMYLNLLEKEQVTVLNQTPTAFYNLLGEHSSSPGMDLSLRYVIFGGEALNPSKLADWKLQYPETKLINMFGITETTVHVTFKEIGDYEITNHIGTIGTPIPTLAIYLFDEHQRLVPRGVRGELCIGGEGVARGYLNNEKLTADKFTINPYNPDQRLYRSGDVGRVLSNGEIEYLGRLDDQVKIRGFRIELGEVESRLSKFTQIEESVVAVKEKAGDKYLVGYYRSIEEVDQTALRSYLSTHLPDYMVPAYFVRMQYLPLTSNGKIDRAALPDPEVQATENYVPPSTREEKILCDIWSKVLGVETVGVTENFFSIGGDSIKSIQISARLRQAGYELAVKEMFTSQTIAELSLKLKETTTFSEQGEITGAVPLTGIQTWFFQGAIAKKDHYNQSVLLGFEDHLSEKDVSNIFSKLQDHHDALRMTYVNGEGGVSQVNQSVDLPLSLAYINLTDKQSHEDELLEFCNEIQASIDLKNGPLMKLGLAHFATGSRLLIVVHHLVMDGISWRILFEDVESLYSQLKTGAPFKLPLKTDSFQKWSLSLREYIASKSFETALTIWPTPSHDPQIQIVRDHPNGSNTYGEITTKDFALSRTLTSSLLHEVNVPFKTQINDILLAALLQSIQLEFGEGVLSIDLEAHGREEILPGFDITRTMGWFTSIYPVVLENSHTNLSGLIKNVKESLRAIPNSGVDYFIDKYLTSESKITTLEEPNPIMFNYLGQFDSDTEDKAFFVAPEPTGSVVSLNETRTHDWDITGIVTKGKLNISLSYSHNQYNEETITNFLSRYERSLIDLIGYCNKHDRCELTPSDLTYKGLSMSQLDALQDVHQIQDIYQLAPMQEGMLFHSLLDENANHYFEQISYRLQGTLAIESIEKGYKALVNRYDVLRTIFLHEGYDTPLQLVLKDGAAAFSYKDIREEVTADSRESVVQKYRSLDRANKFILNEGPLMRVTVYQTGHEDYEFIWSHHHILMDGWCMSVIVSEFNALYKGNKEGIQVKLPQTQPYANYIKWLQLTDRENSMNYWRDYLSGYNTMTSLPKSAVAKMPGASTKESTTLLLTKKETKALAELSSGLGVTLNTVVQTFWAVLLSRYNNVNDVLFGAVVSGRPAEVDGIETMMGLFINTIPVRIQYDPDCKMQDLLQMVQRNAIEAEAHHYNPLSEIQSMSTLGMGLMDHIFVFENYPVAEEIVGDSKHGSEQTDYSVTEVDAFEENNYDLSIKVIPRDKLSIGLTYNPAVYDAQMVEGAKNHLNVIISQSIADVSIPVSNLDILSLNEKEQQLIQFNDTKVAYQDDATIIGLFERQVKRTPDKVAIVHDGRQLSYKELGEQISHLASHLQAVRNKSDLVAVYCHPSLDMVVGILAVLKAGMGFLPLDPNHTPGRHEQILQEAKCDMLLTDEDLKNSLSFSGSKVIFNDLTSSKKESKRTKVKVNNQDLAYVIYTSGSTGKPKGVKISHCNLINYVSWFYKEVNPDENDRLLLTTSFAFDAIYTQFFTSLLFGLELHILSRENYLAPDKLINYIGENEISMLKMTPTLFNMVINDEGYSQDSFKNVAFIMLGGEAINAKDVKKAMSSNKKLKFMNHYGPTETTIGSVAQYIPNRSIDSFVRHPTIGKPIHNTRCYILDKNNEILPIGCSGELCIAGDGVGLGYLGDDQLTTEKFVENPYIKEEKMYRTGDLARWLSDGHIEFLGRIDDQIKIRGFRIELGEVENQLISHAQIDEVVIAAKENEGDKYLVAYYLAEHEIKTHELKEHLLERIPDYMLPAYYVCLDAFPLTDNGKVDKKMLPDPHLGADEDHTAPSNKIEEKLALLWAEVLRRDANTISVNKSFFDLGGQSLKATVLVNKISKQFDVEFKLKDLFTRQNIKEQAEFIELNNWLFDDEMEAEEKVETTI